MRIFLIALFVFTFLNTSAQRFIEPDSLLVKDLLKLFQVEEVYKFNLPTTPTEKKIKNDYFGEIKSIVDNDGRLILLVVSSSTSKFAKNQQKLYSDLISLFGSPSSKKESETIFEKNGLHVEFFNYKSVDIAGLRIRPITQINIFQKYDQFDKITRLTPTNFYPHISVDGRSFTFGFSWIKEKDVFMMSVSTSADTWAFIEKIKILLEDGEVISKSFATRRDVEEFLGKTQTKEIAVADFTTDELDKIHKSKMIQIRLEGKSNIDFELTKDVKNAFETLYDYRTAALH